MARERVSTVYFPAGKITMLPGEAVERATLAQGKRVAAASLYLIVDAASLEVRESESRLEWLAIADNLRHIELDARLNEASVAAGRVEGAHGEELLVLWRLARPPKVLRGGGTARGARPHHNIRVTRRGVGDRAPPRGTPGGTALSRLLI